MNENQFFFYDSWINTKTCTTLFFVQQIWDIAIHVLEDKGEELKQNQNKQIT